MTDRLRKLRFSFAALLLVLVVGCSVNEKFVYKPAAPVAESPKLPVKVTVLPFKDGTEDFTKRGSELFDQENLMYNLAKAGIGGHVNALTPELWAKAFADEMAASGSFQAVRFAYSPSELVDEEYFIEGTLEKAYLGGTWVKPNQFEISLRALRRTDNRPVWEKRIARTWKNAPTMYDGCGMGLQCMVDRHHADYNQAMQSMFAEARTDLVKTIAPFAGNRGGEGDRLPVTPASETGKENIVGIGTPAQPAPESVDETIESIIRGH